MTLTEREVTGIQELLDEMDDIIKERGHAYALGAAQFWLRYIVQLANNQKEVQR